ncbi:MAG: PorV/PorQ family protein [Ignavibacteriaceae bacterium]
MKKLFIIAFLFSVGIIQAQAKISPISTMPGAFSRMGFGARGIGMGNAMSAVTEGNLVSYYNPALTVFQKDNSFQTSYTFLSLNRSLNFLNFTRRFDFYSTDSLGNKVVRSSAGISLGVINSGVSQIDGRDGQGFQTGNLSTSENQFFIALANRFSKKFSLGMSFKFYYYKLYQQISSTGFGLDIGALYRVNDQWNVSFMLTDLNSKYTWDSTPIYQQSGTNTVDKFPLLKKIGVSYSNKDYGIIAAIEFESSNGGTNILRGGIEYNIYKGLYLRGGLDQFNLSNSDYPARPSLGFSYFKEFGNITIGVDYAFVIEQNSPADENVIGLNINF